MAVKDISHEIASVHSDECRDSEKGVGNISWLDMILLFGATAKHL
jgi:hypothetical protein